MGMFQANDEREDKGKGKYHDRGEYQAKRGASRTHNKGKNQTLSTKITHYDLYEIHSMKFGYFVEMRVRYDDT